MEEDKAAAKLVSQLTELRKQQTFSIQLGLKPTLRWVKENRQVLQALLNMIDSEEHKQSQELETQTETQLQVLHPSTTSKHHHHPTNETNHFPCTDVEVYHSDS